MSYYVEIMSYFDLLYINIGGQDILATPKSNQSFGLRSKIHSGERLNESFSGQRNSSYRNCCTRGNNFSGGTAVIYNQEFRLRGPQMFEVSVFLGSGQI